MTYVEQTWADGNPAFPVSAARMQHIEDGIFNAGGGGGAVSSVFTRTGAVTAANGDYYGAVAAALTGVTAGAARFVGSLAVGAAPVSGTFLLGDFTVNQDGSLWICTSAGSPGTWVNAAASGNVVRHAVNQTAHGFTVGKAVRYASGTPNAYVLAKADVGADADVDGLVSAVVDANNFVVQVTGYFTGLSGLAIGSDYFLDPSTAGALTPTEPSTAGQVSKPLLHADTATSGYLINMRGLVIPANATITKEFVLIADATALTTGEDFASFTYEIGADLDGWSLGAALPTWTIATVSSSGLPSLGLRKNASTEMLSTNITIDASETASRTAATPAVIKSDGSQIVAAGDIIHFDCDGAGTGAKGSKVRLTWTSP